MPWLQESERSSQQRGGRQYRSVVRFLSGSIRIHAGETVEWTNLDATEPHTVTFGTEPPNPMTPVNVSTDADGAAKGTINSASDSLNSGFLGQAPQEPCGTGPISSGSDATFVSLLHIPVPTTTSVLFMTISA